MDDYKLQLISKIIENTNDLGLDEATELVGLNIHEVIQEAIEKRLAEMSFEELLVLL